jgi:hypothetical protein
MDLQKLGCVFVDSIELARNMGRWRALVNAVMKLRVSRLAEKQLVSQKGPAPWYK